MKSAEKNRDLHKTILSFYNDYNGYLLVWM